jgi:hypothetical protein
MRKDPASGSGAAHDRGSPTPLLHVTLRGSDAGGHLHRHFAALAEAGLASLLEARLTGLSQQLAVPMEAPAGGGEDEEALAVEVWAAWRVAQAQQHEPLRLPELQRLSRGQLLAGGGGKAQDGAAAPLQLPAPDAAAGSWDLLPVQRWGLEDQGELEDAEVAALWPADHVASLLLGAQPPPGASVCLELHQLLRWVGVGVEEGGGPREPAPQQVPLWLSVVTSRQLPCLYMAPGARPPR